MNSSTLRRNRVLNVAFTEELYRTVIDDAGRFRAHIDTMSAQFPELFPSEISSGYLMKDIYHSRKLQMPVRRIKTGGVSYTVRPSFAMPYLTGRVKDVERAMLLRKFNVPFWVLARVFGKNPMDWFRMEQSIGRNSIVGTTVKNPENLPVHLTPDEKHSRMGGQKVYVATTTGGGCILGASISRNAGEDALKEAYGTFKEEARNVNPDYAPLTITIDGWPATCNAWMYLFEGIVAILCFLHIYISIRDRAKNKFKSLFTETASRLWNCFQAPTKASFSQRVRRLYEWGKKAVLPSVIMEKVKKLKDRLPSYAAAYDYPAAPRTTNMVDRLMQRMDRHLFSMQYFHGWLYSANLGIRAWALIMNFAPSNPLTVARHNGLQSPSERLNRFRYSEIWVENLLISASMGGYRASPQKSL